jgi:hypothetical protein
MLAELFISEVKPRAFKPTFQVKMLNPQGERFLFAEVKFFGVILSLDRCSLWLVSCEERDEPQRHKGHRE